MLKYTFGNRFGSISDVIIYDWISLDSKYPSECMVCLCLHSRLKRWSNIVIFYYMWALFSCCSGKSLLINCIQHTDRFDMYIYIYSMSSIVMNLRTHNVSSKKKSWQFYDAGVQWKRPKSTITFSLKYPGIRLNFHYFESYSEMYTH